MKILIVDDEKLARSNIMRQLEDSFTVIESPTYEDAVRKLGQHRFDLCYIDLRLDQGTGLKGLELIPLAVGRGIYTVVMTSVEDEEVVEAAYERGCQDVYNKGNEQEHISETLSRYFISRDSFTEEYLFKDVIQTENRRYKAELKKLLKVLPTEIPLILLGESGTGKSHLARVIHQLSKRKGSFVELNCSTFSGDTLKSELFGHVRGSFTGAVSDKVGKLAEANHGTLFLDEIGSMNLEMQEGLLKALEEKSFYPVGSNKLIRSDFRIVCATLDDLGALIRAGKFRFDLFQRISGYTFTQPPLRERKEDIFPLLKGKLMSGRKIIFKEEARRILTEYHWPGNIRELLRFGEVIALSQTGVIRAEDVQEFTATSSFKRERSLLEDRHYELIQSIGLKEFLELISREAVARALEANENRARKAIAELKISSATFYRYQNRDVPLQTPVPERSEYSHELH